MGPPQEKEKKEKGKRKKEKGKIKGGGEGRDLANIKAKSSQARQCTSRGRGGHVVEVLTVRRWRRLHIDRYQKLNKNAYIEK